MTKKPNIPRHLGLILDGNRRWAEAHNLPSLEGHRKGYENLKTIVRAAMKRGVSCVSAYVFSTENWERSKEEREYLMKLLVWVSKHELGELHKEGIRIRFVGSRDRLSNKVLDAVERAEQKTKMNTRATIAFCFNYSGQQEIADAVKAIIREGIPADKVKSDVIAQHLYAPDVPPVDLIIRTSGEQRLSNFMLWRAAYSELYFVDKLWPDFSKADLDKALDDYAKRERRFGK